MRKTNRVVVAHEAVRFGGFGAEVAAQIQEDAFDYLDAPVGRVAAPYSPVPFTPALEQRYVPDSHSIAAGVARGAGPPAARRLNRWRAMATDVPMPKLGLTMEEATIIEWLVADGSTVEADQPILLIETDKTETEVGSPGSGRLHQIGQPGDVFPCGQLHRPAPRRR